MPQEVETGCRNEPQQTSSKYRKSQCVGMRQENVSLISESKNDFLKAVKLQMAKFTHFVNIIESFVIRRNF
jgi:hypothetical protein